MQELVWLQSRTFWLPAAVSLLFLVRLWQAGELYGRKGAVFIAWFLVALGAQALTSPGPVWIAGLVGQLALAIVVVLKDRIDNIY